jgi:hypothetical protein
MIELVNRGANQLLCFEEDPVVMINRFSLTLKKNLDLALYCREQFVHTRRNSVSHNAIFSVRNK